MGDSLDKNFILFKFYSKVQPRAWVQGLSVDPWDRLSLMLEPFSIVE